MDRSRVFRSRYRWFGALLPLVMWSASVIASSDIPPIHDGAWRDIRRADGKSVPVYYANLDDAIDAEFRALCESEPEDVCELEQIADETVPLKGHADMLRRTSITVRFKVSGGTGIYTKCGRIWPVFSCPAGYSLTMLSWSYPNRDKSTSGNWVRCVQAPDVATQATVAGRP